MSDSIDINYELQKCHNFFADNAYDGELKNLFVQHINKGYSFDEVNAFYGVEQKLEIPIGSLFPEERELMEIKGDGDDAKVITFPAMNSEALTAYVQEKGISADDLIKLISESVGLQIQVRQQAQPANIAPMAADDDSETVREYFDAPFAYSHGDHENISLNSGAFSYTTTDLALPGKNGLDLVIRRRYDSSQANDQDFTTSTYISSTTYTYTYRYSISVSGQIYTNGEIWPQYVGPTVVEQGEFECNSWSDAYSIVRDREWAVTSQYPGYQWMPNGYAYYTVTSSHYQFSANPHHTYSTRAVAKDRVFAGIPNLGYGWSLSLPAIEYNRTGKTATYLHMGDGRVLQIGSPLSSNSADNNLVNHGRSDLRLSNESGNISIHGKTVSYKYILYHKDGRKDYMGTQDIAATIDRYGNAIRYDISYNSVTVVDTFGRTLKLEPVSGGYRWTGLPDGKYITYSVSGGRLTSCVNQEGEATTYEYQNRLVECCPSDNDNGYAQITYTALSAVNHPTGARTEYSYATKSMYISSKAYLLDWLVCTGRKDIDSGVAKNAETYQYTASYLKPNDYISQATVTKSIDDINKLITTHKFSNENVRTSEEIKYNSTVVSSKTIAYDNYKFPKTETYTAPFSQTISYGYDKYGNLINATDALGNKADMQYHATYNYLIRKEYKKDEATTIVEEYAPRSNGLDVEWHRVYVNGSLQKQTQYYYSGNEIREERCYYGDLAAKSRYLYTAFTYSSPYTNKPTLIQAGRASHSDTPYPAAHADTNIEYDWYGKATKNTDALGNSTQTVYDSIGRVKEEKYADGTSKKHVYTVNASGKINRIVNTDENGNSKQYDYTGLGQIGKVYDLKTNTLLTEYQYDALCRLQREISYRTGDRLITDYACDYLDRQTLKRQSNQQGAVLYEETVSYNDAAITETKTVIGDASASNVVTTATKDKLGRVTRKDYGGGCFETFTYDFLGNKKSATNARGAATKWDYDFEGRIIKETNELNKVASTTYDALGNKASSTDFIGNATTYKYDATGRLVEQLSPFDGSYKAKIQYTYDAAGNVVKQLAANNKPGQAETFSREDSEYDKRYRLKKSTLYDGSATVSVTEYSYDNAGNKTQVKTGSFVTKYEYNQFGNVTKQTDALGKSDVFRYDNYGIMTGKTDRTGNVISYTYDALGRPLTESAKNPQGVTDASVTYAYTKTGEKKSESNTNLTVSFTYDALGRVKTVTESNGVEKTYTYDTANNRTAFVLKRSGATEINTGYAYDLMDRMTSVTEGGAVIASYTYDDNGNRLTLTNANGTSVAYSYNQANLVTSLTNKKGSAVLSSYTYEYQLDGNQTKKTDHTGKATTCLYDGTGRLVEESESGGNKLVYAYDAQGNRKTMTVSGAESYTVTYTYDANNRLHEEYTLRGKTREYRRFSHDANGNQLTKQWECFAPIGTATASVGFQKKSDVEMFESRVYNGFNQLVGVFVDNVNATYTYRPDGLRYSKETFDYKTTQNTVHLWDGQNICAEQNASGVFARYLRGVNLIARRQDNLNQYYHFNAHGNVVQRTDHNGVTLKSYAYDAFGVEKNPEPLDSNPFRYCAEYFDKETKTVYLRARNYSPMLGRFTSEDSAQDGLNWYTYCNNSPIRHVDPTGHWVNVAIGGLIGGAIGWGTNLFTQLSVNSWNFGAIDQRSLWAATGAGVLTGAMAGATMGLSLGLGGAMLSGALIGGAGYGAYNILNGTPATLGGYAGAMASSGLTAGVMHTAVNGLPSFNHTAYLSKPASSNGTLNIGAGQNPIAGAYNIDIDPSVHGVYYGNATNLSNIATGSQSKIFIQNPYKYSALNPEVSRVLQNGGTIEMIGNRSNQTFNRYYTLGSMQIQSLGYSVMSKGPMANPGTYQQTTGKAIQGTVLEIILQKTGR